MTAHRRLRPVPDSGLRRTVMYRRVSAVMGRGDDMLSPELQLSAMRELAQRRDLVEIAVVDDIDRTGRDFNREGIQRVIEMARAREFDVLALFDLSRLGRNTAESLRVIKELKQLGVAVVSTVEQVDDTPEGQWALTQFLALAELKSNQVGRQWRQVNVYRASKGLMPGSRPPTGYYRAPRPDGRVTAAGRPSIAGPLLVDPVEGPLVTEAFRRYADGHLISHIARDFSRARGRRMPVVTLKRILRSPIYIGRVRYAGGEYPGSHEPLTDEATWDRVQRRLERDARTAARHLAVSHELVGLVVCDACGHLLQLHNDPRDGLGRLQCRWALRDADYACPGGVGTPRSAEVVDAVLAQIPRMVERLSSDDAARAAKQARRARAGVDVGRLRRELERTEEALGRLTVDYARRQVGAVAYQAAAGELERTRVMLAGQLAGVEQVAESPAPRGAVAAARALPGLWAGLSVPERNRALRMLVREVRVRRAASYREPVAARVEVLWL